MPDDYLWFQGIPFPPLGYELELLRELRDKFVVRDEDTVILTYPKSGTHWLIETVCLIRTKGDSRWVQTVPLWERSPWIETYQGYPRVENMKDPRLYTSHLPMQLFPRSFFSSKAKVIYLMRNPKDILVSGYHFWRETDLVRKPESLEEYFECFTQGRAPYGSWFEHTRGWLSMRGCENFLLLTYEDMKKDPRSTVEKICCFLGKTLEPGELELVLQNSSFQVMKDNKMSNLHLVPYINPGFSLMRKGTCGDWKSHFTPAQTEAFDKVFREKMAGFPQGLFPWE